MSFVHLHVHTDGSELDGMVRPEQGVQSAVNDNQPAFAITDHGTLYNLHAHARLSHEARIKPIFGLEAYIAPTDRTLRETQSVAGVLSPRPYTHMTLWARTNEGLANLYKFSWDSYDKGMYYKPRGDRESLSQYSKGLMGSTGCLGSEVNQLLLAGHFPQALEVAGQMRDIFGAENFFVEMMDHGIKEENALHRYQLDLARKLGVKVIATNDSHYTSHKDAPAHQALLCVQTGSTVDNPKFSFAGHGYHLRTAKEMRAIFSEAPEACDNTLLVAEMCEADIVDVPTSEAKMPHFPVPQGHTEETLFREKVIAGAKERYGDPVPKETQERIDYETETIVSMGYPGYFLIVADFIDWARKQGIRVGPGRGSCAGSAVAYCMNITQVEPISNNLLFERFLNPERISLPDIDVDFDDSRRDEVIAYMSEKYGRDRVSQVLTYQVLHPKSAVRDAARSLGFPYREGDEISKTMPESIAGKEASFAQMLNPKDEKWGEVSIPFRGLLKSSPDKQRIVETAQHWEGLIRNVSTHASAVVLSSEPMIDAVPMMRNKNGLAVTQFDYPSCEALGLVKFDFLGLSNLRVISDALDNIKKTRGVDIDIDAIALDDPATLELVRQGNTIGTFQLSEDGMRKLLKLVQASSLADIAAVSALNRPGPMGMNSHLHYADRKTGRVTEYDYIHPELNEILRPVLSDTYGVVVYQEQVMRISQVLAGYSLAQADNLRRVMGKKKAADLAKEEPRFREAMLAKGFSLEAFTAVWNTLLPFADYAFNASHAYAYGLIAYQTCWLKANYPSEYMAAVLSSKKAAPEAILGELKRMGVSLLAPDINRSGEGYTPLPNGDIVYGLASIVDIGDKGVANIMREREQGGQYTSLTNFLRRNPSLTQKNLLALVSAGALDSLTEITRRGMSALVADSNFLNIQRKKASNIKAGIRSIFEVFGQDIDQDPLSLAPEWDEMLLLEKERYYTGMFFSGHPYSQWEDIFTQKSFYYEGGAPSQKERAGRDWGDFKSPLSTATITSLGEGDGEFSLCGMVTSVDHLVSRKGNPYVSFTLEDMMGKCSMQAYGQSTIMNDARQRERIKKESVIQVVARIWEPSSGEKRVNAEFVRAEFSPSGKEVFSGKPKPKVPSPYRTRNRM